VVGYRDVPGKPALFGTTKMFLDYFNLKSLYELPPMAEIREIEDFDPQLTLGPVAPPDAEAVEESSISSESIELDAEAANDEPEHAADDTAPEQTA